MKMFRGCVGAFIAVGLLVAIASPAFSQFVEKYRDTGPDDNRAVLVITGDGYTAAEQSKLRNDSVWMIDRLLSISSWNSYNGAVNVYIVGAVSQESGADRPPEGIYRNTIFDATYYTYGMERLLTVNNTKVFNHIFNYAPTFDRIFVVVNDTKYGGSGGAIAVTSVNTFGREVLIHEVGHSYAGLVDEYHSYTSTYPGGEPSEPNSTKETNRNNIKWKAFINPATPVPTVPQESYPFQTGLFEGSYYYLYGIYRPAYTCKMRDIGSEFCQVCKEAHARRIHLYANLVDSLNPVPQSLTLAAAQTFTVASPAFQYLEYRWKLDGQIISGNPYVTLTPLDLQSPYSVLNLTVTDNTPFIANFAKPASTYTWNLTPVIESPPTLNSLKLQMPGSYAVTSGRITAAFPGEGFYVQSDNWAGGVKVGWNGDIPEIGKLVTVTGHLDNSSPNLTLVASIVTENVGLPLPIAPLTVSALSLLGGVDLGLQPGVTGGSGVNTIGLLVRVTGVIVSENPQDGYFVIKRSPSEEETPVRIYGSPGLPEGESASGRLVSAVGISVCVESEGSLIRAIRTRNQEDIILF